MNPNPNFNSVLLDLLEATVSLYATDANGNATGNAIWSGAPAEKLRVEERWVNVETRASGAHQPKQHPLVAQYQIAIERVWALPLSNLAGWQADEKSYVLDVVWADEEPNLGAALASWHRRTFYGVTIAGQGLDSREIDSGHTDGQEFLAQYFIPASGQGTVPAVGTPVEAYVVIWVGPDGTRTLYTYDPVAGSFTETSPGAAASRATVAADGSSIVFASGNVTALTTTVDGLTLTGLHDSLPTSTPRLEFWLGTQLVAALTPAGFWAPQLSDVALGAGPGFQLQYNGTPVAMLAAGQASALAFNVPN